MTPGQRKQISGDELAEANRLMQEALKKEDYLEMLKVFQKLDLKTLPDDHPVKTTLGIDTPLTDDLVKARAVMILDTKAMAKTMEIDALLEKKVPADKQLLILSSIVEYIRQAVEPQLPGTLNQIAYLIEETIKSKG